MGLDDIPMSCEMLESTGIGRIVSRFKTHSNIEIAMQAMKLVKKWKQTAIEAMKRRNRRSNRHELQYDVRTKGTGFEVTIAAAEKYVKPLQTSQQGPHNLASSLKAAVPRNDRSATLQSSHKQLAREPETSSCYLTKQFSPLELKPVESMQAGHRTAAASSASQSNP